MSQVAGVTLTHVENALAQKVERATPGVNAQRQLALGAQLFLMYRRGCIVAPILIFWGTVER